MFANASNVDARYGTWNDVGGDQYNNHIYHLNSIFEALSKASAMGAAFDSGERHPAPKCLPGTRHDVLTKISEWISSDDEYRMCWLSGIAGSGKSAIAQSIAELCSEKKILAASFFFSRRQLERSIPSRLFPTVAYQLTVSVPSTKDVILKSIEDDPFLPHKIPRDQFRNLIINPLIAVKEPWPSSMVIIIDSLDECADDDLAQEIISLLTDALRDGRLPFRVFVTSRPAPHIQAKFADPDILPITRSFTLSNFDAQADIRTYLEHSFTAIAKKHQHIMSDVPKPWPSEVELDTLVKKSAGLFIFASTAVKVIDGKDGSPTEQLKLVLDIEGDSSSSPNADLDQLYLEILSGSPNGRFVVGIIIHLFDPLPACQLENLLGERGKDVAPALEALHPVLLIPEDSAEPIRIHHTSLRDFLTDPERSGDNVIDSPACQGHIARLCLQFMNKQLRRDICNLKDSTKLNSEVADINSRCEDLIDITLRYACRRWASHLSRALPEDALVDDLRAFAFKALLYWVEELSLVGDLENAVSSLHDVTQWLKTLTNPPSDLLELFRDAERFVLEFFDSISLSSLHVYYTALPFTPQDTLLRRSYAHELTGSLTVMCGLEKEWSACLRVISLKSAPRSVAFSPDSTRIISGSDDGMVHLWSATTGVNLSTLDTQGKLSHAALFSPNGTRIATGCKDGMVHLWDAMTCHPLITRTLHDQAVSVIVFSPDSSRLASVASDKYVQLWDATTGRALFRLSGHEGAVTSISFSYDSARAVSGSADHNIRMWDINTGHVVRVLKGHTDTVNAVAVSCDGHLIISGSSDRTVRLWETVTGKCLIVFKGHTNRVTSVAFSRDATRIVSASPDLVLGRHLLLWNIDEPGSPVCLFSFHDIAPTLSHVRPKYAQRAVNVIASAPELARVLAQMAADEDDEEDPDEPILSGTPINFSVDIVPFAFPIGRDIFVIDNLDNAPYNGEARLEAYRWVTSAALSSDGTRVASTSNDNTLYIWDTCQMSTGLKPWGGGHNTLSYSSDGTRFIHSSVVDSGLVGCVELMDSSGKILATLHDGVFEYATVFSPDSSIIARYCKVNGKIKLFDAVTGGFLRDLKKDGSWLPAAVRDWKGFACLVFSPDGTYVTAGCKDGTVWVWDVATGRSWTSFRGHQNRVWAVAYSPDGAQIVSGSKDGTVRLWDVKSKANKPVATLSGHESKVTSVAFSPDGARIAVGYKDGSMQLWYPSSGSCNSLTSPSLDNAIELIVFSADGKRIKCRTKDKTHAWDEQRDDSLNACSSPADWHLVSENNAQAICDYSLLSSYSLQANGWIFDGPRRVCWVPTHYRARRSESALFTSCGPDKVAMYADCGLVILDLFVSRSSSS